MMLYHSGDASCCICRNRPLLSLFAVCRQVYQDEVIGFYLTRCVLVSWARLGFGDPKLQLLPSVNIITCGELDFV